MEIENLELSTLINVEQVVIDQNLPVTERMMEYLEKVKNPYCFLCGETPVKICFMENEIKLEKKLKEYFLSLKR
ncbi:MAG: hypothetical protein J6B66_04575 [Anaerotignum sp.]|nr:hypothetical protein [Anaerotignum sp.]